MLEESKVLAQDEDDLQYNAFNTIPYALISAEKEDSAGLQAELTIIQKYYKIYRKGVGFYTEGTNGDYVPANLKYCLSANLVDKEARFLFSESPDVNIVSRSGVNGQTESNKQMMSVYNSMLRAVLDANNFDDILLKAAKDCFIGKRVAGLINFNEEDGCTITFLPSTQFIFETKLTNPNVLSKFVCFIIVKDSLTISNRRIFKKKYTVENGDVYLEESLYSGGGSLIQDVTPKTKIELDKIPAVIFLNDGLTGDLDGESDISTLMDYEKWYSKLSNADIDSERKSMNPIRYAIDMDNKSTKNLKSGAGAFWDLQSDQNLDKSNPSVGMLESGMNYSDSLKTSLDRLKTTMYESVDVPNVSLETMQSQLTSGKALKAIYWPLTVRCKEKMKMWGSQLANLISIILDGAVVYQNCMKRYTSETLFPVDYRVEIIQNTPLLEDESEEKTTDLQEVESKVMSKKAYMQKWRQLSDSEVDDELKQMAEERTILEDSTFDMSSEQQL